MSGTRHFSTSFEVSRPPDAVAAYLSNPRHFVTADHEGPVVDGSEGPLADGSWYVLAFDQLRTRIEYTSLDLPRRIVVTVQTTGLGSSGVRSIQEYVLRPLPDGRGTLVEVNVEGSGGCLPGFLGRAVQKRHFEHVRDGMERGAAADP